MPAEMAFESIRPLHEHKSIQMTQVTRRAAGRDTNGGQARTGGVCRGYFNSASIEKPSTSRIFFRRLSASIWICRTRSRVTPISLPTSSRVETG